MKYTTPALMNNTKKLKGFRAFFLGQSGVASYYRARHKTDDVFLLWIEASQFGKLQCFPCVLQEDGDAMVFEVMKGVNTKMRNADLVRRWGLFAAPQTIAEEYVVEEMQKNEFYQLFGEYRQGAIQKEIEKEYAKQGKSPEEARSLAAAEQESAADDKPAESAADEQPESAPAAAAAESKPE